MCPIVSKILVVKNPYGNFLVWLTHIWTMVITGSLYWTGDVRWVCVFTDSGSVEQVLMTVVQGATDASDPSVSPLVLSVPTCYRYQYVISTNMLSVPTHYHYQHVITTNTLSLQHVITTTCYLCQHVITTNTLSLPTCYRYQHVITTNMLLLPTRY